MGRPERYSPDEMAAFHRAMHEAPGDTTAPLVYADWLEEHGRPTVAAFIRRHTATKLDGETEPPNPPVYSGAAGDIPDGEFLVTALPFRDAYNTSLVLRHASAVRPGRVFSWVSPVMGTGKATRELAALDREGVALSPHSAIGPHVGA